jgi:hypothetical protein
MDRRTLLGAFIAGSALGKGWLVTAQAGDAMNPSPRLTLNAAIMDGKLRLDYVVENSRGD